MSQTITQAIEEINVQRPEERADEVAVIRQAVRNNLKAEILETRRYLEHLEAQLRRL